MIKEKIKKNKKIIVLCILILSVFFGKNLYFDIFLTIALAGILVFCNQKELMLAYIYLSFFEEAFKNDVMRWYCFKDINTINFNKKYNIFSKK